MSENTKLGPIWVFDESSLERALESYQEEALEAYPHQRERILITVEAMRDFLHSPHAKALTMKGGQNH